MKLGIVLVREQYIAQRITLPYPGELALANKFSQESKHLVNSSIIYTLTLLE